MHDLYPILLHALRPCVAYWPDLKENVPPGAVWVSLYKPKDSLEKAMVLALGEVTGRELPEDFVNTGVFEDRATNSLTNNEVTSIRVTEFVQNRLNAGRHIKEDEKEEGLIVGDGVFYQWAFL